mmetsp:Transcript_27996/g.73851  ORF Transcript_27996/g.73851 Transcript_27996/m.73851 type:complete len:86 (-) Transcript_27996:419-676(-)
MGDCPTLASPHVVRLALNGHLLYVAVAAKTNSGMSFQLAGGAVMELELMSKSEPASWRAGQSMTSLETCTSVSIGDWCWQQGLAA